MATSKQIAQAEGFDPRAKKVIVLYIVFQFLFTMLFWVPIFFEFQERIGLSAEQIFRIQTIYYLAFCLLEIPTGLLADKFGWKRSMQAGAIALVISQIVASVFLNFDGQLWLFLLVALARAFISGASTSYLYEFLRQSGQRQLFERLEGRARAYTLLGKVFCFAIVGFMFTRSMISPFIATGVFALASLIVTFFMPQVVPNEGTTQKAKIDIKAGIKVLTHSPWLVFVMLQGVGIFVLSRIVSVNLFQPILKNGGYLVASFGLVMGILSLFEALGSAQPQWIRRSFGDVGGVFFLTAVMAVSMLLLPFSGQVMTFVWLTFFFLACGFSYPLQRQLMNDAIQVHSLRATFLSFESLIDRAVSSLVALILERLSSNAPHLWMKQFLVGGGLITLVIIALQLLWQRALSQKR